MHLSKPRILIAGTAAFLALAATAPPPNLNKAVEAQKALTVENPADDAAINDLGNLLRMAGRLDEAETAYRAAIELAPQKVAPRYNLGILLQQRGDTQEALDQYRKVIDLDAGFAWAHYQVGALLEARGDKSQALKAYTTAFALNPELAFPQVNPHVIDNKLLQQALLSSYKKGKKTPPPQAPNTYADPKHIASLFVPTSGAQPAAAMAEVERKDGNAEASSANRGASGGGKVARGGVARPTSPGGDVASRVLSEDSLDERPMGQVSGGKTGGNNRGGTRATGAQSRSGNQQGTSTTQWNWPRNQNSGAQAGGKPTGGSTTYAPPAKPSTGGSRQPAPTIVTPGGFRPGTNSTGRLENRLLPNRPAETPATTITR